MFTIHATFVVPQTDKGIARGERPQYVRAAQWKHGWTVQNCVEWLRPYNDEPIENYPFGALGWIEKEHASLEVAVRRANWWVTELYCKEVERLHHPEFMSDEDLHLSDTRKRNWEMWGYQKV